MFGLTGALMYMPFLPGSDIFMEKKRAAQDARLSDHLTSFSLLPLPLSPQWTSVPLNGKEDMDSIP